MKELDKIDSSSRPTNILYTKDDIANANSIKVSRTALKKMIEDNEISFVDIKQLMEFNPANEYIVNQAILDKVISIIEDYTNVRPIEPTSHFMVDLGCSSLDYFTLVSRLNNEFGISMPYLDDYDSYTVRGIAKVVEGLLS